MTPLSTPALRELSENEDVQPGDLFITTSGMSVRMEDGGFQVGSGVGHFYRQTNQLGHREARILSGEAYMMCNECGARLFSFDGEKDASRNCPYNRNGSCDPTYQRK